MVAYSSSRGPHYQTNSEQLKLLPLFCLARDVGMLPFHTLRNTKSLAMHLKGAILVIRCLRWVSNCCKYKHCQWYNGQFVNVTDPSEGHFDQCFWLQHSLRVLGKKERDGGIISSTAAPSYQTTRWQNAETHNRVELSVLWCGLLPRRTAILSYLPWGINRLFSNHSI